MTIKFILCFLLFSLSGFSQDFNIYIFNRRYNKETQEYFKQNQIFKSYHLLSMGSIIPKKTGDIDLIFLKKSVEKIFPNYTDSGFLNIDIENEWFKDLRDYNPTAKKYKVASEKFVIILKYLKKLRPNIKLGIYGIPFRFYYDKQKKVNMNKTYTEIFAYCDYISPSLYILSSEKENRKKDVYKFLRDNLDVSFAISKKLNKPVIPFFWYMINTSNSKYGAEIISEETMRDYIDFLKLYSYEGVRVKGILWWDPSETAFNNLLERSKKGLRWKNSFGNRNQIIKYYKLHTLR